MTLVTSTKDDEIREYHLKRLEQLCKQSIKQKPQLDEPNQEQQDWVNHKMKGNARSWEVWDK